MPDIKFKDGTIATILSTELNSLASNAKALSSAHNNGTDLDFWADFELAVTFGTAPTAGANVELYLLESLDDTNYMDGSSSVDPPANTFIGAFYIRAVNTAQRVPLERIPIPPRNFKILLWNKSGQAFPASGSTVKIRKYKTQSG